jgi:stage II sporulation protein D
MMTPGKTSIAKLIMVGAMFAPEVAAAGEKVPEVLIRIGGGYPAVAIGGSDLTVFGSDLDPEARCLTDGGPGEKEMQSELEALIASGGRSADNGSAHVRFGSAEFKKLATYPGKPALKFAVAGGGVTVNGERTGRSHIIVEASHGGLSHSGRQFRGRMELVAARESLILINRLPVESYLRGMLDSEMSHSWPMEALKAQAVASRSYAMYQKYFGGRCHYHMESSVLSQVYRGLSHEHAETVRAVEETRGEVLAISGEPVMALFHSCCGGETQGVAGVFGRPSAGLEGVKCGFDAGCPLYRWTRSYSLDAVSDALKKAGLYDGLVESVKGGAGERISVAGSAGEKKMRAAQFRAAIGYNRVPSGVFDAVTTEGRAELRGKGYGHGVGMCQYGARGMARAGWDYGRILRHYFPGAEIMKMY